MKQRFIYVAISFFSVVTVKVGDRDFEQEVIEKSKKIPVLVDFWAEWCMPCLMFSPILESLSEKYNGKFILAKVNVDENPDTSKKYNIMSIPTAILFKNGKPVDEFIGAAPKEIVEDWLKNNIYD